MRTSAAASSLLSQYAALRSGRAFVELRDWSSVTICGTDRQAFLHNFCTNDLKRLTPGTNCEAFFTTVKGRIVGHGLVTCRDTELVIVGPPGQGTRLAAHLNRYVIRENVTICDSTGDRSYALVSGGDTVRGAAIHWDSSTETCQPGQAPHVNIAGEMGTAPVRWIRWDLLRPTVCGLLEAIAADLPRVTQTLIDEGAVPCDQSVFQALRIESGTPLYGIDFDDRNLPQEVGRNEQSISFTKGCYLGQETVARIDALGHVNQQLVGIRFLAAEPPEVGAELLHLGRPAGHVTSATLSPHLRAPLALAMVRREQALIGTRVDSPLGAGEVVALPV